MEAWKGEGWTEWELLKTAPSRFKGHYQPLKPTWGCFDESDADWSAREIDLAADHGIDVMLFDWYWYSGVKIMEEALEKGFLGAPNRHRLKFALMWANHHWCDYFPAPFKGRWNSWLPIRHSPSDLDAVIDYCIGHYFQQPNYWRLGDEVFFSIFLPALLVDQLGGAERTRRLLQKMDRKMHARGLPSIHWNAMTKDSARVSEYAAAGFKTTTCYNVVTNRQLRPEDRLVESYDSVMKAHRRVWREMTNPVCAHMPMVTMGWDVTPRCEHDVPWPFPPIKDITPGHPFLVAADHGKHCYPYIHVVVGNTPKKFGRLCRDAADYLEEVNHEHRVVFLNAWNEWTEGCYLLPERRYGDGFLKAVRAAYGCASSRRRIGSSHSTRGKRPALQEL